MLASGTERATKMSCLAVASSQLGKQVIVSLVEEELHAACVLHHKAESIVVHVACILAATDHEQFSDQLPGQAPGLLGDSCLSTSLLHDVKCFPQVLGCRAGIHKNDCCIELLEVSQLRDLRSLCQCFHLQIAEMQQLRVKNILKLLGISGNAGKLLHGQLLHAHSNCSSGVAPLHCRLNLIQDCHNEDGAGEAIVLSCHAQNAAILNAT